MIFQYPRVGKHRGSCHIKFFELLKHISRYPRSKFQCFQSVLHNLFLFDEIIQYTWNYLKIFLHLLFLTLNSAMYSQCPLLTIGHPFGHMASGLHSLWVRVTLFILFFKSALSRLFSSSVLRLLLIFNVPHVLSSYFNYLQIFTLIFSFRPLLELIFFAFFAYFSIFVTPSYTRQPYWTSAYFCHNCSGKCYRRMNTTNRIIVTKAWLNLQANCKSIQLLQTWICLFVSGPNRKKVKYSLTEKFIFVPFQNTDYDAVISQKLVPWNSSVHKFRNKMLHTEATFWLKCPKKNREI